MGQFVNCILVLTESSLVDRLYDDDDISGLYGNPFVVAGNIEKASFVGWTVPLPAVPSKGDCISLMPFKDKVIAEWKDKMFLKDPAITHFINLVKHEPRLGMFWCKPMGERYSDNEVIEKILSGIPYDEQPHDDSPYRDAAAHKEWVRTEGLCEGRLIVTEDKIYVPGHNTVVVGVEHEL